MNSSSWICRLSLSEKFLWHAGVANRSAKRVLLLLSGWRYVERMTWRYSERGYRFLHLDAGHVCQNLYLAAEAISSGVCAIGGYNDNDINPLLGLDGRNHFVIYIATLARSEVLMSDGNSAIIFRCWLQQVEIIKEMLSPR